MKSFIVMAAAVGLFAPASVWAQNNDDEFVPIFLSPEDMEINNNNNSNSQRTPPPAANNVQDDIVVGETSIDEGIQLDRAGQIEEWHFRNMDIRDVLRILSQTTRRNIIVSKSVQGVISADLYNVTFDETLHAICMAGQVQYIQQDNFIYVVTRQEAQEFRETNLRQETRIIRLYYISAEDAEKLVRPMLSDTGNITTTPVVEEGLYIGDQEADSGGFRHAAENVLVVRDFPDNIDQIEATIKALDLQPKQVLIEATILSARLDQTDALGVNMSVLMNASFGDITGGTPITFGQANIQDASPGSNSNAAGIQTNFTSNFPDGSNPMRIGVLSDNVAVFIEMLEQIRDTTVLANPKLLVVNKQRGHVLIGRREGYLTTSVTAEAATQEVEWLEVGIQLIVRPFVGKDGVIRMEIHPKDSDGNVRQVGEGDAAAVLPTETTTQLTSNVLVRDGRTIVIGGLFRDRVVLDTNQAPGLGDIPIFGQAFRSDVDVRQREEVIILITPHIIDFPSAEAVGEQLLDDVDRYMVGARKGMKFWSRSRLADSFVQWAKRDISEGNLQGAMWNIDNALARDPRMIEAIRIKEQLSNKAYWEDMPEEFSAQYLVARMMLQELGKDYHTVTPPGQPRDVERIDPEIRRILGIDPVPTESGLLTEGQTNSQSQTPKAPGLPAYEPSTEGTVDSVAIPAGQPRSESSVRDYIETDIEEVDVQQN